MDAPPCTVDDAIDAINRCATHTAEEGAPGRDVVHCIIPSGSMMLGADRDTESAIAAVRAAGPETIVWRFSDWGMVLYVEELRDGRIVPLIFDTVHPRDDATLPGHPDVLLSELAAIGHTIEYGDTITLDTVADTIRANRTRS